MSLLQHLDTFLSTFMYLRVKSVLKYSTKFTGKDLYWGTGVSFANKAAGRRPATSLNIESGTGVFPFLKSL